MFGFIKEGLLKCGLYLQVALDSEVAFKTGLTVYNVFNIFHLMMMFDSILL